MIRDGAQTGEGKRKVKKVIRVPVAAGAGGAQADAAADTAGTEVQE